MNTYREFQFSSVLLIFTVFVSLLTLYRHDFNEILFEMNSFTMVNGILILIYLLFYGMTTKIDDERIVISLGIGLIKETIEINEIRSMDIVKNPWYVGWGVRLIPNGTLYNAAGLESLELKFKGTKEVIRIGTKNPTQLRSEISRRLTK